MNYRGEKWVYGGNKIVCPYCGERYPLELDGDPILDPHTEECPKCEREFECSVEWYPSITSYRYAGRTDRIAGPEECRICKEPIDPLKIHPSCPMCKAVVCDRCEKQMKPCCDEYARWAKETKEAA